MDSEFPSRALTDRYSSNDLVGWWDRSSISRSTVLIAGVGALGNEVAKNVALAGVGTIVLVDFDVVEVGNLSRSVLFRESDIGKPKVIAARSSISRLNPDVHVIPLDLNIENELGAGVVSRCDVVLGCLDSRASRRAINRLCCETGTMFIDGGLRVLDGSVKLFNQGGPCYECGLTETDYNLLVTRYPCPGVPAATGAGSKSPGEPTLISAAAIAGGLMSQVALLILCGQRLGGGWCLTYRGLNREMEEVILPLRDDCPAHACKTGVIKTGLGLGCTCHELISENETVILPGDVGFATCQCGNLVVHDVQHVGSNPTTNCRSCGSNIRLRLTHRINAEHPLAGVELSRLGLPRLAWVKIEINGKNEYRELDMDEIDVFTPGY